LTVFTRAVAADIKRNKEVGEESQAHESRGRRMR
jgi:hypothetical protein